MSNANSGCLYLKERFSPLTAEEYVLSSWFLVFCFVYFTKDKTKSDAIPYFIKCRRKHLGTAAKRDKVQTSLNRNTYKPSYSACWICRYLSITACYHSWAENTCWASGCSKQPGGEQEEYHIQLLFRGCLVPQITTRKSRRSRPSAGGSRPHSLCHCCVHAGSSSRALWLLPSCQAPGNF